MRRSLVVVAVLLGLAVVLIGGPGLFVTPSTSEGAPESHLNHPARVVTPGDAESGFWPYLSPRREFQRRSPINVVVYGDTDTVIRVLTEDSDTNWQETAPEQQEADSNTHSLRVEVDSNGTNDTNNSTNESFNTSDGNGTGGATADNTSDSDAANTSEPDSTTTPDTETDSTATDTPAGTTTATTASGPTATNDTANESAGNQSVTLGATTISWTRTTGATRYAYVHDGQGDGRWVTETAQIHDGTYYGDRYHIRMYESPSPDEPWVIMQTHHEHFDWFTLRHRVDGSQEAQMRLESDLMATPQVDVRTDVSRRYLANSNRKDADGWATVVDLREPDGPEGPALAIVLLAGTIVSGVSRRTKRRLDDRLTETDRRRLAAIRERADPRHLLLAVLIVGIILGVRLGGIALERTGLLSMHAIAAVLYPFISVGLPVGTYLFARGLTRRLDAAVVAGGSLAVAVWLDYSMLGVTTLSLDVIGQRMLVVVALGLIAGGATRRANRETRWNGLLLFGVGLWVLLLAGTLFGYL